MQYEDAPANTGETSSADDMSDKRTPAQQEAERRYAKKLTRLFLNLRRDAVSDRALIEAMERAAGDRTLGQWLNTEGKAGLWLALAVLEDDQDIEAILTSLPDKGRSAALKMALRELAIARSEERLSRSVPTTDVVPDPTPDAGLSSLHEDPSNER